MKRDPILEVIASITPYSYETIENLYALVNSYDAILKLNDIALEKNIAITSLAVDFKVDKHNYDKTVDNIISKINDILDAKPIKKEIPMNDKRTDLDFSKHELKIIKNDEVLIHELKMPDTICQSIKFINCHGIMAVTGDYGKWIFCREFHPSASNFVSDGYWCEKIHISSSQVTHKYDPANTRKLLQEHIDQAADYGYDLDDIDYFKNCMKNTEDGEFFYRAYSYENLPKGLGADMIVVGERINGWLPFVFDGFDEICNRLKIAEDAAMRKEPV